MHTPGKFIFQQSHLKTKREKRRYVSDVDDGVHDYNISQPRT